MFYRTADNLKTDLTYHSFGKAYNWPTDNNLAMRSTLDYETPFARSKPRRTWIGVLVVSAIGCGFVAWGIAAEATHGALPDELAMSSFLVAASLGLAGLAIGRWI